MRFINFCRHKRSAPFPSPRTRSTFTFPRHRDVSTSSPIPQQQTPCYAANVNNNAGRYCCDLHIYTRDSLQLEYPGTSRQTARVVQLIMDYYKLCYTTAIRATYPEFQIVTHYHTHTPLHSM
jgi:hypothetical protein